MKPKYLHKIITTFVRACWTYWQSRSLSVYYHKKSTHTESPISSQKPFQYSPPSPITSLSFHQVETMWILQPGKFFMWISSSSAVVSSLSAPQSSPHQPILDIFASTQRLFDINIRSMGHTGSLRTERSTTQLVRSYPAWGQPPNIHCVFAVINVLLLEQHP